MNFKLFRTIFRILDLKISLARVRIRILRTMFLEVNLEKMRFRIFDIELVLIHYITRWGNPSKSCNNFV